MSSISGQLNEIKLSDKVVDAVDTFGNFQKHSEPQSYTNMHKWEIRGKGSLGLSLKQSRKMPDTEWQKKCMYTRKSRFAKYTRN